MARYRFALDILDKDDSLSAIALQEIMDAARSAAKITIPAENKRTTKVTYSVRIHGHEGVGCQVCLAAHSDGVGNDVTDQFVPTTV